MQQKRESPGFNQLSSMGMEFSKD
jgi:serine/threonine-protein kinase mTOR